MEDMEHEHLEEGDLDLLLALTRHIPDIMEDNKARRWDRPGRATASFLSHKTWRSTPPATSMCPMTSIPEFKSSPMMERFC